MADPHDTGNVQPELDREEHLHAATGKRVVPQFLLEDGQYGNEVFHPKSNTNSLFTAVTIPSDGTATLLASANTDRRKITFSRGSDAAGCYLGPTTSTASEHGIPLNKASTIVDDGIGIATTAWYASCNVTLDITVIEWEK